MDTQHQKNSKNEPELEVSIPVTEKLKTIPEFFGIRLNEEPRYQVVKGDGEFEIRQYEPLLMAKVTIKNTNHEDFRKNAFVCLANYIFGKNSAEKKLSMTSPVLQNPGSDSEVISMTAPVLQEKSSDHEWTMAFILPQKYSLTTAPQPIDKRISLAPMPTFLVASIRYSGNNSQEKMDHFEKKLQDWVMTQKDYLVDGAPYSAQYDAPFVLSFVKKNEIHIRVHRKH